jgi:hypothetical protein
MMWLGSLQRAPKLPARVPRHPLDTCQAAAAAPKWLFVQMADMCKLYRNVDGEYHIESSKFHKNTEWFTDRPFQFEATQPTSEWFNNFTELFDDEKGMPNAGLFLCLQRDTSRTQKERAAEKGKHMGTNLNNPLLRRYTATNNLGNGREEGSSPEIFPN